MIEKLIEEKIHEADVEIDTMASYHEGFSYLRIKIEAAYEEVGHMGFWLETLWDNLKTDGQDKALAVDNIRKRAVQTAEAMAVVAAFCDKIKEVKE